METTADLSFLKGRELESVVFVRDYMQLVLNDATFSLLTWPVLYVGEKVIRPEDPIYHRAACAPIDSLVTSAHVENEVLTIEIGDTRFVVSLRAEDRLPLQVESATLMGHDEGFWAW